MTAAARPPGGTSADVPRISSARVEWVKDRLSSRDWQIIHTVNQLRAIRGEQLQRVFFSSLPSTRSQVVSRARVLRRLAAWRVLAPLERRIGGSGRGSSGSAFSLDSIGQRLVAEQQRANVQPLRVRRPDTPGDRTLKHTLAVTELYVRLIELSRVQGFTVAEFAAEPGCWWPDGRGFIKPDAYVRLVLADVVDHLWVEVDMATESPPTLRRKLETYLDFVRRGQFGPQGVVPRVLVSAVTDRRRQAVAELVGRLPQPADKLFAVVTNDRAAAFLGQVLRE